MFFILGEDCELSIGIQDYGESGRDPMTWEEYRIVDFKPFIAFKPKFPICQEVVVKMTKEQALKIKQSLDLVWSDQQLGGADDETN